MRLFARSCALAVLAFACCQAQALTQEQVVAGAAVIYRHRMAELEERKVLDADPVFFARVQRVARRLIAQAQRDYPETAHWQWEVHTTTDEDENASCMAGGKLLVGAAYVNRLELDDAELAMLLAHEMAHAFGKHNLKEFEAAMRLDPRWETRPLQQLELAVDNDDDLVRQLEPLNFAQEIDADREGLRLAWRAGWPAKRAALYFKKLVRASAYPYFDSATHPSPSSRWAAARALAETLEVKSGPAR